MLTTLQPLVPQGSRLWQKSAGSVLSWLHQSSHHRLDVSASTRRHVTVTASLSACRWQRVHTVYDRTKHSQQAARSFSSSSSSSKLGLGGYSSIAIAPSSTFEEDASSSNNHYQQIIRAALEHGVDTMEVAAGSEAAFLQAYRTAVATNPSLQEHSVDVLIRVGYRTETYTTSTDEAIEGDSEEKEEAVISSSLTSFPHDVAVEDSKESMQAHVRHRVVHNISPEAIRHALLQQSSWTKLLEAYDSLRLVVLLHNPEVQGGSGSDGDRRQEQIQARLAEGFQYLETLCGGHPNNSEPDDDSSSLLLPRLHAYGVVSNGLSLPSDHPLHLHPRTVLQAASSSSSNSSDSHFRVVQLPANLLERNGFQVARVMKEDYARQQGDADRRPLQIYAMRPLACYPDLGTGTGKPLVLADYLLTDDESGSAASSTSSYWTYQRPTLPDTYYVALQTILSHLDADDLRERQQLGGGEEALSADELETLQGCQLLQSLIQDLDAQLESIRSVAAHQDDLLQRVIPILHQTFQEYDDETAGLLQAFFVAYGQAVRWAVAKNTRQQVMQQQSKNAAAHDNDTTLKLSPDSKLQEYGLRFVLEHQGGIVDKVIVGAASAQEVVENATTVSNWTSKKEPTTKAV